MKFLPITFFIQLVLLPIFVVGDCTCDSNDETLDKSTALKYKIAAIVSILIGGAIGVCLPMLGKAIPALQPERDVFFIIKTFAAGVILATGFIHVLPDAFESLTSPCLGEHPWADFSFTGFIAMVASMGTLMVDALATSYFSNKSHFSSTSDSNNGGGEADNEQGEQQGQGTHGHTHATNGHAHGSLETSYHQPQLLRHRVIAQVLELGIIVHSIIIGISLGASRSPNTIRPLVAALTFHQFFEGMGLGGCITQAKFKAAAITLMVLFFSLTTPVGIVIGIGISNVYDENSTTALIVEGVFNAASSGILIYMALVDLLAADFMSAKMQKNLGLQLKATVSLLVGAGCMSLLAKWA